jgi:hypothetical protein
VRLSRMSTSANQMRGARYQISRIFTAVETSVLVISL